MQAKLKHNIQYLHKNDCVKQAYIVKIHDAGQLEIQMSAQGCMFMYCKCHVYIYEDFKLEKICNIHKRISMKASFEVILMKRSFIYKFKSKSPDPLTDRLTDSS